MCEELKEISTGDVVDIAKGIAIKHRLQPTNAPELMELNYIFFNVAEHMVEIIIKATTDRNIKELRDDLEHKLKGTFFNKVSYAQPIDSRKDCWNLWKITIKDILWRNR